MRDVKHPPPSTSFSGEVDSGRSSRPKRNPDLLDLIGNICLPDFEKAIALACCFVAPDVSMLALRNLEYNLCFFCVIWCRSENISNRGVKHPPPPHELFRGGRYRQGQPPREKSKFFWTLSKTFARPTSEKPLPSHSWRPLIHKSHIECTSPSSSKIQHIWSLPLSKKVIDWDFIIKVKLSIKKCN